MLKVPGGSITHGRQSFRVQKKSMVLMIRQELKLMQPLSREKTGHLIVAATAYVFGILLPVNFKYGPIGDPDKFFALWMDGYSQVGDGSTIWLGECCIHRKYRMVDG